MNEKIKGSAIVLLSGTCWGFSGTCGQYLFNYKGVNAEWLTSYRMLFAGIIMVLLALLTQKQNIKGILSNKLDRIALLIFGIAGLMTCQYTYFAAIARSNAATGTVLQYLGPALILVYMCIRYLRLPKPREVLAIVLAITGTFLIATHGDINNLAISPSGLFFGLLSAFTLAVYTILPGRLIERWGSLTVTGLGMLIAGVIFTIVVRPWNMEQNVDFTTAFLVVVIVLIGTAMPFTLYLKGVSIIGASKGSMLACIEPVSATVFSALWLKNIFTVFDLAGFALIIITVLILSLKDKPKKLEQKGGSINES